MDITYSLNEFSVKVNLFGELDHHHAKKIIAYVDKIIDIYMPSDLIIDFNGVSFMDSSGIAVLLGAYRKQTSADSTMKVINVPPQPMKVFKAAGIMRYISIDELQNIG